MCKTAEQFYLFFYIRKGTFRPLCLVRLQLPHCSFCGCFCQRVCACVCVTATGFACVFAFSFEFFFSFKIENACNVCVNRVMQTAPTRLKLTPNRIKSRRWLFFFFAIISVLLSLALNRNCSWKLSWLLLVVSQSLLLLLSICRDNKN